MSTAPSQTACEMGAYIGVAVQAHKAIQSRTMTDDELRLALVMDRFTASEIEREFATAKAISAGVI